MDGEEEGPNKETKDFFESVGKGDEEVVKFLLQKQFKLDINFKFKDKVFQKQFSFPFFSFFLSFLFSLGSLFLFFTISFL